MGTIFVNSGKSKGSDPRKLLFNLSDEISITKSDKKVIQK